VAGAVHIELLEGADSSTASSVPRAKPEIDVALREHRSADLVIVVELHPRLHRVDAGELRCEHQLVHRALLGR
jgi:hypothetical protein